MSEVDLFRVGDLINEAYFALLAAARSKKAAGDQEDAEQLQEAAKALRSAVRSIAGIEYADRQKLLAQA